MSTVIVRILDFWLRGHHNSLFKNVAEDSCLWEIFLKSVFGCEVYKQIGDSLRNLDMSFSIYKGIFLPFTLFSIYPLYPLTVFVVFFFVSYIYSQYFAF